MNQPPKKRHPSSPQEWILHARSDLKLASLGSSEDVLPEQICFHAQQAVEKALKSALLAANVDFPFTHDLEELLDIIDQAGIDMPHELKEVGALTPYAVESRYPGYWGEISVNDVSSAVSLAEKTVAWAERFIAK